MVTSLMLFLSCPLGTGDGKDASPFFYLNDAKIQSVSSEKSEVAEQPLHSAGDNSNGTACVEASTLFSPSLVMNSYTVSPQLTPI